MLKVHYNSDPVLKHLEMKNDSGAAVLELQERTFAFYFESECEGVLSICCEISTIWQY